MLKKIAKKIARALQNNNIILQEEMEIYEYGILLLMTNMLTTICIFLIGYYINLIGISVLFSIVLVVLRTFAGGYVANSYFKNFIYSLSTYLIIIGSYILIPIEVKVKLSPLFLLISALIIYKYTPNGNKDNFINENEKNRNKLIGRIILIGILGLSIVFNKYTNLVFFVSCILLNISLNIIIELTLLKEKSRHNNEEAC